MNEHIKSGTIFKVEVDGDLHVLSEDYFYKTEAYYTLVSNEIKGIRTIPSSKSVLEAYIVSICLEKASLNGIKVPEWGVSYIYAPTPCLVYGMNYYSTPAEHYRVDDLQSSREDISSLCHGDKYTYMFQRLGPEAIVSTHLSIYGEVMTEEEGVKGIGRRIYEIFGMPIVNIVLIRDGDDLKLSSLSPVKYSKFTRAERDVLRGHLNKREAKDG